ncbi:MAG: hypothetical protein QM594_04945 [Niabella sp.]
MRFILLLNVCILLVIACKKGNDTNGNNWQVPKIKTEQSDIGFTTSFYDREGRHVKVENNIQRNEFTYEPGKVILKTTELESNGIQTTTYELNANGYLAKDGNTAISYTQEGYRKTESTLGSPNRFVNYHYNSATGLLDSITTEGNGWERTQVYTYYTDKQETTGNDNRGALYLGKSMPHPIKSVVTWNAVPPPVYREKIRTSQYTYLYDEKGRIVKKTISSDNATGSSTTIYTYY